MIFLFFFTLCMSLLISFYFSGTEAGFLSINKEKYSSDIDRYHPQAMKLKKIIDKPEDVLGITLIGNNLGNVIAAQAGLPFFLIFFNIRSDFTEGLANLMTVVMLFIFGEALPKIIFKTYANRLLYLTANILLLFRRLFYPFTVFIIFLSDLLLKLFFINSKDSIAKLSRKDFSEIITDSYQDGLLNKEETHLFNRISSLSKTKVIEMMKPLANLLVIHKSEDISNILDQLKKVKFDFIPVCDKRIDNIIGYINVIDVFNSSKKVKKARDFLLETVYIPETNTLDKVYEAFSKSKNHVFTVVDEYGGCSGILLEKDIIDRIFGFHYSLVPQSKNELIKKISHHSFEVNTLFDIDDFNVRFQVNLPKNGYETLGGFINHYFQYIPEEGEMIEFKNIKIVIMKSNNVGVDTVHVTFENLKNVKKKKIKNS